MTNPTAATTLGRHGPQNVSLIGLGGAISLPEGRS
jgi:hypothetical protein